MRCPIGTRRFEDFAFEFELKFQCDTRLAFAGRRRSYLFPLFWGAWSIDCPGSEEPAPCFWDCGLQNYSYYDGTCLSMVRLVQFWGVRGFDWNGWADCFFVVVAGLRS